MLEKLRLKSKILLMLAVACLSGMVLLTVSVVEQRKSLIAGRQAMIKAVVESAHNILSEYQAREAAGMPRADAQKAAIAAIAQIRYGGENRKAEYLYVYQMDGINIHHVRKDLIGTNVAQNLKDSRGHYPVQELIDALKGRQDAFVDSFFPRKAGQVPVAKLQYLMSFEPWGWFLGTGVWMDDLNAELWREVGKGAIELVILLLVLGSTGAAIVRSVMRQVGGEPHDAIARMERAAEGDLRTDGIQSVPGSMLGAFDATLSAMRAMLIDIRDGSHRLRLGAEKIAGTSHEVADAAQEQSDATSAMAAAIEEMTVSVNHISDSAADTERRSSDAARLAGEGEVQVSQASAGIERLASTVSDAAERIHSLDEQARKISTIAAVIKEIAGQTNLLALNAAIEAARAGEQGRGFAVVADEVRKLAERTSLATVEIEQMIAAIQGDTSAVTEVMAAALPQVDEGVRLAGAAAGTLRAIRDGAQLSLERIREVAEATREQGAVSTSIAQRVEQIARMVEQTSGLMRESAATASDLQKVSDVLNAQVDRFQV
ncbi:methyl-accepting chemotaxis protein [Niveibacterium terrae]|uniref:methyl-accepting chemotaxis protein n=1 Tax=Niveibacterium terrae TaxID=3373598 RepID=UPI003A91048D